MLTQSSFIKNLLPQILFLFICILIVYPTLLGLILLPLDLLITRYSPWHQAATILIKNPYMQDSIIQMYPWKIAALRQIFQHTLPLWNPYQFTGLPFAASLKPMIWYPLNICFLLGEKVGWNIFLASQIYLSLLFTYMLCRSLHLSRTISVFVSISFSFSSLMIGVLQFGSEGHVLLWAPLLLMCIHKYIQKQKNFYLLLLSLATSCVIFAGQFQYAGYIAIILISFLIYQAFSNRKPFILYLNITLAGAMGILLSSIQSIPTLEMYQLSARNLLSNYDVFGNDMLSPIHWMRLLSPDYFGNPTRGPLTLGYIESSGYFGIIPFFLALYAVFTLRHHKLVQFCTTIAIITFIVSLRSMSHILFWLKIPLITNGSGSRLFYFILFVGPILAGFGLKQYINQIHERKTVQKLVLFIILLFISYCMSLLDHINVHAQEFLRNNLFQIFIFGSFTVLSILTHILVQKNSKIRYIFTVTIICLTLFDAYRLSYRFLTFSNSKFLYPITETVKYIKQNSTNGYRSIGLTEPDIDTYFQTQTLGVYNPLYPLQTARQLKAFQDSTDSKPQQNKFLITNSIHNKKLFDTTGVKYVIVPKDENPSKYWYFSNQHEASFTKVHADEKLDIYENNSVSPRWKLYYDQKIIPNPDDALTAIANNMIDLNAKIILPIDLHIDEAGNGTILLTKYKDNVLTFKIQTDQPAIFQVTDAYFPGWYAYVNDTPTNIYISNGGFRAIKVPKGESNITIIYKPFSFVLGMTLSMLGILAIAIQFGITTNAAIHKKSTNLSP